MLANELCQHAKLNEQGWRAEHSNDVARDVQFTYQGQQSGLDKDKREKRQKEAIVGATVNGEFELTP